MEPTFAYARASSNRSSRSTAYAPFKPFQAKTGFKRSKVPVVPGSGPVPQPKIGKRETSASSHIARGQRRRTNLAESTDAVSAVAAPSQFLVSGFEFFPVLQAASRWG